VLLKLPPTWQELHITETCAPVNGNVVVLWSKVAGDQAEVVWHEAQVVGNPPRT